MTTTDRLWITTIDRLWMIAIAIILVAMTFKLETMHDSLKITQEMQEQDMIEYCIDIQPTEYDMEIDNDNNND